MVNDRDSEGFFVLRKTQNSEALEARFEDFQIERNDEIDNAVQALICLMADVDPDEIPENHPLTWNMEIIGDIEDEIMAYLANRGVVCCLPYKAMDTDKPEENWKYCFDTGDCERAENDCPFKKRYNNED